jgi:beta-xylosidase
MKKPLGEYRGLVALMSIGMFTLPGHAQTSGANGTHDPSRMIESDGKVYIYSTGGGGKSSSDGLVWASAPGLQPEGWAQWVKDWVPTTQGLWAPDGIYYNGKYYLYYSVCGPNYSGKNTAPCAVGLKTTPTLNSSSPNYKFVDQGMVVANNETTTFGSIDPAPVVDAEGNLWVVWGGGDTNPTDANAIWVTRMDNATGLPLKTDPGYSPPLTPGHPLIKGHKEGPYMYYHSGYYYLFWNTGSCCSGTNSSYKIHMSRSQSITGPFPDDKMLYQSNDALNIHGPGHIGIYSCGGEDRFTYHYYPNSGSILGENTLTWGSDGWPVAGTRVATPLKLGCATATTALNSKPKSSSEKTIQIQKTGLGYRILVPGAERGETVEILNVHGKRIGSFQTGVGWSEIPEAQLASGVNIIRMVLSKSEPRALILNKD